MSRFAVIAFVAGVVFAADHTGRVAAQDFLPSPAHPLVIVAADGDIDEDGELDGAESSPPLASVVRYRLDRVVDVTAEPPDRVRVGAAGGSLGASAHVDPAGVLVIQAMQPGRAVVTVTDTEGVHRIELRIVRISFLDGANTRIDPRRAALEISREVTNAETLPRDEAFGTESRSDLSNTRIEIEDPGATTAGAVVLAGGAPGRQLELALHASGDGRTFRSSFVRFVGDATDAQAPGVMNRVLRVALRDRVTASYRTSDGTASTSLRVGRPGAADELSAAREGRLRVRVLRMRVGGPNVFGMADAAAIAVARNQVAIANEVWSQCAITFGDPATADVQIADPPPPALIAFSDRTGLPARGGGQIRLRVDGREIGPIATASGESPVRAALNVARALRAAGFVPRVTENPSAENGAGPSADVVVRRRNGTLAEVREPASSPVSTDARLRVAIGRVDLADGLSEFDNLTLAAGTLEERTLIKLLADDDPTTIDILIVNRFSQGARQGEAFIEADGGPIVNTLILDRNGVEQEREAWTQSHEIGHILLDHPLHPDNVGPDRPWLLMDADDTAGFVTGPKRLTFDECARAARESGVGALPELLRRHRDADAPSSP